MKKQYKSICKICGKEFIAHNVGANTCPKCYIIPCVICGKLFNSKKHKSKTCSKECSSKLRKQSWKKRDVEKMIKKSNETCLKHFGVINPSQSEIIKDKKRNTCLKNHGVTNIWKDKEKRESIFMQHYGVNNISQSKEYKEKMQKKHQEKYGTFSHMQDNWNEYTKNILLDKNNFINWLLSIDENIRTLDYLASLLSCTRHTIYNYTIKYNCNGLLKYYSSKEELEILNFLNLNKIEYVKNDKNIISPYELDFYLSKYKVALEINGTYWHSSLYKDKFYHYNKSKLCEEKGIRLIHIWEYEWNDKRQRPILENIILSACGKIKNKIYARNCKIEIRESKSMKQFFEENNIQGFRGGKFAICLIYNNEVVMSYIMGKAFFGKGKYEWEVIRGATKLGYSVVGGASKIWKYFKENYNPQSCVYYVDYNYFNGKSIQYLDNFKFIKTQPGFKNWYKNKNIIENRIPSKHMTIKKLEKEGFVIPIYNAGTKVYVWENKKTLDT